MDETLPSPSRNQIIKLYNCGSDKKAKLNLKELEEEYESIANVKST